MAKKYDSTVARIAGNIMSGMSLGFGSVTANKERVALAVKLAREVVRETQRTEPAEDSTSRNG